MFWFNCFEQYQEIALLLLTSSKYDTDLLYLPSPLAILSLSTVEVALSNKCMWFISHLSFSKQQNTILQMKEISHLATNTV